MLKRSCSWLKRFGVMLEGFEGGLGDLGWSVRGLGGCSEGFDGSEGCSPHQFLESTPRHGTGKPQHLGAPLGVTPSGSRLSPSFPLHFPPFLPYISCSFPVMLPTNYPLNLRPLNSVFHDLILKTREKEVFSI